MAQFVKGTLKSAKPGIIYIQNELDTHHMQEHYGPFALSMGYEATANETEGMFRRLHFSHEGGHRKAETPEVFTQAMAILEQWQ